MDTPGISLFQGADLQINNSKNVEEEEDLEDQQRRKEELQNLLQAKLDDFNYDDSTINSSTNVSIASVDNLEQLYKEALSPDEQIKILYDVRCREILALKEEYDKFKADKSKEVNSLKNQKILLEGELRQAGISMKNLESLLVDKTEEINNLTKNLKEKDTQMNKLQTLNTEYEGELVAYKSEVTELHLKLQKQKGAFNLDAKFDSDEMRNSMQSKIEKLEKAYEEQTNKFEFCNAEKQVLQDEIARLAQEKIALESDNEAILKSFDSAQLQCKDLINVIEVLKTENDHFKCRVEENSRRKSSSNQMNSSDTQSEKLKSMLVDKSIELDSLKTKLNSYEDNIKELLEYRQLKCDIYKKEFQKCDNKNHTKELLIMQNDLQNYRRIIEDKKQQILSLNANNKDLKEKIEDMILQTRNEIQNMSSKYNMPQLDSMKKELEKSEKMVNILTKKLQESEEERLSLFGKLNESKLESDYELLKNQLKNVMEYLEKNKCPKSLIEIKTKMQKFIEEIDNKESIEKGIIEEQINSWKKLLDETIITDADEALKTQYKEAIMNLQSSNEKIKELEEGIQDLKNSLTIAEGEKCGLSMELKDVLGKLEESEKSRRSLEEDLKNIQIDEKTGKKIDHLKRQLENQKEKYNKKTTDLEAALESLSLAENDKEEQKRWMDKMHNEIEKLKNINTKLERQLDVKNNGTMDQDEEAYKLKLKEELNKMDIILREEIQIEYQNRITDLENEYKKTYRETSELCKKLKSDLEQQDKKFREYLKLVLKECETCSSKQEIEKTELIEKYQLLQNQFEAYKINVAAQDTKYFDALKKMEIESQKTNEAWRSWSKKVVCSCLDIEATNKKVRDRVLASMDKYDQEVAAIQKKAEAKMSKKSLKKLNS
ncbi:unnamed protein product [Ceutorhynchus assimilis]|uniref:Uncharacterized protein n=1 Tax=Ceutorhynchus assimilis TaxID=467358 RepID=A0A9N9MYK4_9CUCU|nr:unnamed protein product [Ceutorhynchus assimilis]